MNQIFKNKTQLKKFTTGKALFIGISGADGTIRITRSALNEYLKGRKYCEGELYIEDWYAQIFFKMYQ